MKLTEINIYEWWEYRSPSQHVLLLLLCIFGIYFLWSNLLFKPLTHNSASLEQQIQINKIVVKKLQGQADTVIEMIKNPVASKLVQQNNLLQQQLAALNIKLGGYSEGTGASSQIISFLKILLNSNQGLTLVNLQHSTAPLDAKISASKMFRQDITIEFAGGFFPALHYLESVEKSPWRFFNDELDYQVIDYPEAKISLKLHTLSI